MHLGPREHINLIAQYMYGVPNINTKIILETFLLKAIKTLIVESYVIEQMSVAPGSNPLHQKKYDNLIIKFTRLINHTNRAFFYNDIHRRSNTTNTSSMQCNRYSRQGGLINLPK